MIITRPLRLMTLHFSQIGFTDALTFILPSARFFFLFSALLLFRPRTPRRERSRANNYFTIKISTVQQPALTCPAM
jgi:hypothetical protein